MTTDVTSDVIKRLGAHFEARLPAALDLLRQMVAINSFSANPSGVDALGRLTAGAFEALGFAPEFVPSANPDHGNHLVLCRTGRPGPMVGLISHLDTVYPPEEEERNDFHWREEGDRIYGPGSCDIKGGTAMAHLVLGGLRAFWPGAFEQTNWIILLNAAEERLAHDFGALCRTRLPADALAALVFEAGRREGARFQMVTARKGMITFQVRVEGRGAHAGSAHQEGANAVVQLARTIDRIANLTDYGRDLTFNVGTITGGTVLNRVPHQASAGGEARAFRPKVLSDGQEQLLALARAADVNNANGDYGCRVDVELCSRWEPWPPNTATERLLRLWQASGRQLGFRVEAEQRGGLSDGNFVWDYVPTLDGLGPAGGNAHCSERSPDGRKQPEFVQPSSFVPKACLNVLSIAGLIGELSK
ncbi:MAG: M20/M25/M40 family metallo-hydrolase [Candidatus Promineifilaceae bacterium]